jgi:PTH1 family peptidyl-tRNA hydrolase
LKVGVGRPPGRIDPADFVLRRFYDRERPDMDLLVAAGAVVLEVFAASGGEAARQEAGEATGRLGIVDP